MYTLNLYYDDGYKTFKFPDGNIYFKLEKFYGYHAKIISPMRNSDDLIRFILAVNALRNQNTDKIDAYIPCFPYEQQDRVNQPGESLSLRAICDVINSLNLREIQIFDPHCFTTAALLNNCRVDHIDRLITSTVERLQNDDVDMNNAVFVLPDAGAEKKYRPRLKEFFPNIPIISAHKVRDVKTGEITKTEVYDSVDSKNCIVVDDRCIGGRTFVELAKVLGKKGALDVYLCVSHGIFSKGLGELASYFDGIFTTNSYCEPMRIDTNLFSSTFTQFGYYDLFSQSFRVVK